MRINIFEGARRIALLFGAIAVIGVVAATATHDPYLSLDYSVSSPNAPLVRTTAQCPTEAGHHYFSTNTNNGQSVGITLCLLTMPFGEKSEQLIPYKVDKAGMIWGAASYSPEISAYEQEIERKFTFSPADSSWVDQEISRRYRKNWMESLGYLVVGLAIYWILVWAIGWIVRGFAGIPPGKDSRSSEA